MLENILTVKSAADMQLPKGSNLVNFSLLSEIVCPAAFRSFSIKYVCNGLEKYKVNDNVYHIQSNQYLLANHFAEGTVEIDKPVKGICIDIAPELLSEVIASRMRPDTALPDISLDKFFTTADFLDNKYDASTTHLGRFLSAFDKEITRTNDNATMVFNKELYYTMAEYIVADHVPVFKQLQNIIKLKLNTRKDLYRRAQTGKDYIDAYFLKPIEIATVATAANLSEYHFFRTFKQVFGISPYQYIIRKRLDFALELLKDGHQQISGIAYAAGFTDVFAFSKSFKKYTGFAPSKYLV